MTNEEELKKLVEAAETNVKLAQDAFFTISKNEYAKLEEFFNKYKKEIALPISCLNKHVEEDDSAASKLTCDFRIRGWKGDSFYIQYKNGESIPLTSELLSQFVFVDGKDIADEIGDISNREKPATKAYADLMTAGKYAVIIYRYSGSEDYRVYIGKIHYAEFWHYKTGVQMSYKGRMFDIADMDTYLYDAVTFVNSDDFCNYVSKYGISNGEKVDITSSWLIRSYLKDSKLIRDQYTIQKPGGSSNGY